MARLLLALLLFTMHSLSFAQTFPQPGKPLRIVVPYPAGGQTDLQARAMALKLAPLLGIPVVVENKAGASSILGAVEVIKSPADGHTLLYTISNTVSQNPHLFSKLPYDAFRDLTPIMYAARALVVLVGSANAPFGSVPELLDHARRNPGKVNFASFSAGSTSHLAGEMLKQLGNVDIVHVPFNGSADANMALFGGHVQMMFDGPMTAMQNAKAGKVKLLAYSGSTRLGLLPDVPTLLEMGLDNMAIDGGMQFFGPGGMSPETASRVNAALATVLRDPEIVKFFVDGGCEIVATSPQEHAKLARQWYDHWGKVINRLGLKLD